ncbi:MAG: IS200/IS605 family accessory protein TnpB-related protein [Thermoplasmata archaeon]
MGHNDGWKQLTNLGKQNNQHFIQLPFNKLIQQIQYKAEESKINVIIIDESHMSKCSFLDNESINVMTLTWERESKEEYSEHQIEH